MDTQVTLQMINIAPTYGASLIGCFLAFAVWGMLCMQVFLYFLNYPHDPVKFKALVAFLWIMDSGHQIVISKGMWRALVTNFGNPAILTEWFPELFLQVLFTGIVGLAAHAFLVYRIWLFSEKRYIFPAILMPLAVAKCVGDIVYVTIDLRSPTVQTLHKFDFLIYYPNAVAAALDIVIAGIMCWLLYKGRTGLKRSDQMLSRMAVIVVNTGMITAIVAVLVIITLVAWPDKEIFTTPYAPICPLYCNTILANLNSRSYLRGKGENSTAPPSGAIVGQFRRHTPAVNALEDAESGFGMTVLVGTAIDPGHQLRAQDSFLSFKEANKDQETSV